MSLFSFYIASEKPYDYQNLCKNSKQNNSLCDLFVPHPQLFYRNISCSVFCRWSNYHEKQKKINISAKLFGTCIIYSIEMLKMVILAYFFAYSNVARS